MLQSHRSKCTWQQHAATLSILYINPENPMFDFVPKHHHPNKITCHTANSPWKVNWFAQEFIILHGRRDNVRLRMEWRTPEHVISTRSIDMVAHFLHGVPQPSSSQNPPSRIDNTILTLEQLR